MMCEISNLSVPLGAVRGCSEVARPFESRFFFFLYSLFKIIVCSGSSWGNSLVGGIFAKDLSSVPRNHG